MKHSIEKKRKENQKGSQEVEHEAQDPHDGEEQFEREADWEWWKLVITVELIVWLFNL